MKNSIIKLFFLTIFCFVSNVNVTVAQAGCVCEAYNSDSHFCIKNGKIYERETCQEYRFVGVNVAALTRLNYDEKAEIFIEAKKIGVKVIRFFAPNSSKSNAEAINDVAAVLAHPEAQGLKFIIVMTDFYKSQSTVASSNENGFYHPQDDAAAYNNSPFIYHEWFDINIYANFRYFYRPWVEQLVGDSRIKNNPQVFAFELGNELKNNDPNSTESLQNTIHFNRTMTGIIKSISPQNLVSTGNLSTWHNLNGSIDPAALTTYREEVYLTGSRQYLADFMTVHNYDNYWTATETYNGVPWHRTDEDVDFARNNGIPWVVEEFGFTGNPAESNPYPGGCWDNPPASLPGLAAGPVQIPDCTNNRPCALDLGIQMFIAAGTTGIMAWGFSPNADDLGYGDKTRGLDRKYDSQYEESISAWSRGSFYIDPLSFWYECDEDMALNNNPNNIFSEITCKAQNVLSVNHKITDQYCINYQGGNSVDFMPGADGLGFEAIVGAEANASIVASVCLDCEYENCQSVTNLQSSTMINPTVEETGALQFRKKIGAAEIVEANIFPMPFQHQTTLAYTLSSAAKVRIELYDAAGKMLQNLQSTQQQAAGNHQLNFGEDLPEGIYFCRLIVNQQAENLKVVKTIF